MALLLGIGGGIVAALLGCFEFIRRDVMYPSRHRTERGSAASISSTSLFAEVDPALPRSVLCLLVYKLREANVSPCRMSPVS